MNAAEMELRGRLRELAEPAYREFALRLIPGKVRMLGVRLPALRALAKQLARAGAWRLPTEQGAYMEEIMLRGMLIGYARSASLAERLSELERLLPLVDNWSICDACCATYAFVRREREAVWKWLQPHLVSPREFEARFAVVLLLMHYKQNPEWRERVAAVLPSVSASGYYAEMAVAWCACELCLQQPALAAELPGRLRPSVQKLAWRKLRESRRWPVV